MYFIKKCLFIFLVLSLSAHASDHKISPYVGVDFMATNVAPDNVDDFTLGSVGIKLGADLHEYFGVEARGGFGVIDDDITVSGTKSDLKLNYYLAGFAKAQTKVYNGFKLYALAGVARLEIEEEVSGSTFKPSDTDFAYGAGVSYNLSEDFDVNLEYLSLNQGLNSANYNSINLGITYNF